MADYAPAYVAGNQMTAAASGPVTGGDPLEVSGSGTVAKCAAATSVKYVGIAAHDAAAGQRVTFFAARLVYDGVADGPVTAGDQLVPSAVAARTVKTLALAPVAADVGTTFAQASINTAINNLGTAVNGARAVCGVALTTAADGAAVRWQQV